MRKLALAFSAAVFASCTPADEGALLAAKTAAVVYGSDDRSELYEETDPLMQRAAHGVAALVLREDITVQNDGTLRLSPVTAGETFDLCSGERFAEQPSLAQCTAVLIDTDLLLTAGHCFEHLLDCRRFVFAFNYAYDAASELALRSASDLYECERLIVHSAGPSELEPLTADYAVVQLTRAVDVREPLDVRAAALANDDPLVVISAPLGVPLKVDHGPHVLDAGAAEHAEFSLNADTFRGSSGAPVLDAAGALAGVLVRGNLDRRYDATRACYEANRLPEPSVAGTDAGFGAADGSADMNEAEDATYASLAVKALCESGYPSARLCGRAPRCGDTYCSAEESVESCPGDCFASPRPSSPQDASLSEFAGADGGAAAPDAALREPAAPIGARSGCALTDMRRKHASTPALWVVAWLVVLRLARRRLPKTPQ